MSEESRTPDLAELARRSIEAADPEAVLSFYAPRCLGLDGLKRGVARAEKLSPEKRSECARMAAQKRWAKRRSAC